MTREPIIHMHAPIPPGWKPPPWINDVHDTIHGGEAWIQTGHHTWWIAGGVCALAVGKAAAGRTHAKVRKTKLRKTAARRSLTEKVGPLIGYGKTSEGFVDWPKDTDRAGAVVGVRIPAGHWHTAIGKTAAVDQLVHQLLGGGWRIEPDPLHDRLKWIRLAPPKTLPNLYEYPDTGPIDGIPVAIDTDGNPVIADLTSQSPHVLVAGGTGGGKTTTVTTLIAHVAARGGLVSICDPKSVGYQDTFEGLHNVRVAVPDDQDEPTDMIAMIDEFYRAMRQRYADMRARVKTSHHPMQVLAIDEMGSFVSMVTEHWAATKPRGGPTKPPVLDQLQKILWQGRKAMFIVICAVQQANATAIGGSGSSDMREMYGMRICCGAPGKRGGPLLFGTDDLPQINGTLGKEIPGRGLVSREGGDVIAAQLAYLEDHQAKTIAARGEARFPAVNTPDLFTFDVVNTDYSPVNTGGVERNHAETDRSPDDPTYAAPKPPERAATEVECAACHRRYQTRSATTSRCTCGHRQRVKIPA